MTGPGREAIVLPITFLTVLLLGSVRVAETTVLAPAHNFHHRASSGQRHLKEHPEDAKHYFHDVVTALKDAEEVLIVGPGTAKLDLHRYIHKMDSALEKKVVAMETVDHPSDAEIIAYSKKYFKQHASVH